MKIGLSVLSLICSTHLVVADRQSDNYTVELVQVLFRHGDRIPEKVEVYKTDPYDDIYQRYGYGELTKIGKEREYKIGQLLRERYGDFLGDFKNSDVYAYSTDIDRTKMSLQLVLAGLYPPSDETSWNKQIHWSPIPTHYESIETSFLTISTCPMYKKLHDRVEQSPEIQKKVAKYRDFYKSLQNKTGMTTFTPFSTYWIYSNLRAVKSVGLPRPDWCTDEDFKNLKEISTIAFQSLTHTDILKQILGGLIIEKFLENVKKEEGEGGKKIYLYAGHDANVAGFINSHNFTTEVPLPDFGSTVIFEKLRGKDDQVYIRMYYWTGVTEDLIPLELDNCNSTCLLSDYTSIVKPVLPGRIARQCTSTNNLRIRPPNAHRTVTSLGLHYLLAGEDLTSFKYMADFVPPSSSTVGVRFGAALSRVISQINGVVFTQRPHPRAPAVGRTPARQ